MKIEITAQDQRSIYITGNTIMSDGIPYLIVHSNTTGHYGMVDLRSGFVDGSAETMDELITNYGSPDDRLVYGKFTGAYQAH